MKYEWSYDDKNNITYDFSEEGLRKRRDYLENLDIYRDWEDIFTRLMSKSLVNLKSMREKSNNIKIWNDDPGLGKTSTIKFAIASLYESGWIYACQSIRSIDSMHYDLVSLGVPEDKILRFYSKDNKIKEIDSRLKDDPNFFDQYSIILITHASLVNEPLSLWKNLKTKANISEILKNTSTESSQVSTKQFLIIDEYCDQVKKFRVRLSMLRGFISNMTKINDIDLHRLIKDKDYREFIGEKLRDNYGYIQSRYKSSLNELIPAQVFKDLFDIDFKDKPGLSQYRSYSLINFILGYFIEGSFRVTEIDIRDKIQLEVHNEPIRKSELEIKERLKSYEEDIYKKVVFLSEDKEENTKTYEIQDIGYSEIEIILSPSMLWKFRNTIILDATGHHKFKDSKDYEFVRLEDKRSKNVILTKFHAPNSFNMRYLDNDKEDYTERKEKVRSNSLKLIELARINCKKILFIAPKSYYITGAIDKSVINRYENVRFTSYGSDTSGSNDYLDCDGVILFGNYCINIDSMHDINRVTNSKASEDDWAIDMYVQCIGRSQIRTDDTLLTRVYSTDDDRLLKDLVLKERYKELIDDENEIPFLLRFKDVRKNIREEIEILYKNYPKEIKEGKLEITLDEIYGLIPKNKKAILRYENLRIALSESQISLIIG